MRVTSPVFILCLLISSAITAFGQRFEATANCGVCNAGEYTLKCVAPVVSGAAGCTRGNYARMLPPLRLASVSARGATGRQESVPFPGVIESSTYNVSQSGVYLLDSSVSLKNGVLNKLTARLRNDSLHSLTAYEVQWVITTKNGSTSGAVSSTDLIFTGSTIGPGETELVPAYVDGIPGDAIRTVVARVSYVEFSDGTLYNSGFTKAASNFRNNRAQLVVIFSELETAMSTGKSVEDIDSEIRKSLANHASTDKFTSGLRAGDLLAHHDRIGAAAFVAYAKEKIALLKTSANLFNH